MKPKTKYIKPKMEFNPSMKRYEIDLIESKPNKKQTVKIYICPKCKSTNVKHPFKLRNLFGIIPRWECNECKFQSDIFPIAEINLNKLKKKK